MNKIGKYLQEISVIVIGIAITLSVSYWISLKNEKRDMTLYLRAIKVEQEENIKTVEKAIEYLKYSVSYSNYLRTNDKNSLNKDSLKSYFNVANNIQTYTFKTNAFEMFKNSGVMRLMDNKKLLLNIWGIYTELIELKQLLDEYNNRKWSLIENDIPLIEINMGQAEFNIIPMYSFYAVGAPIGMMAECEKVLENLYDFISKLE